MTTNDDREPAAPLAAAPQTANRNSPAQRGCGVYLLLIVFTAALSLLAGVYWSGPLHDLLGLAHQHGHGEAVVSEAARATLWTCSMHPQVIQDHPGLCPICHMALVPLAAGGDGKTEHMGALEIDPAVVQNMGVRTAKVRRGPVSREVRTTGYLREAQPKVYEVNLRVSGWIDKLYANYDGMYVGRGDPLFELYSPELHQTAGELINAVKAGSTHIASLGSAARRKLELWGLSKAEIERIATLDAPPRTFTFYSPAAGHVLDKHVVEGAGVMAGQQLFNIVDHSQLWMDITIFERDLPFVGEGDPVSVTTEAHTGAPLEGEIIFIHPHVDTVTRAATARLLINNPDMTYRPGMYATAILVKELRTDALLVPREAIIDTGVRQLIFLARDSGHFEPRQVAVGAVAANSDVEILSGLEESDEVVISGQFLLDNESRIKEAVRKFLRASAEAATVETAAQPEVIDDVALNTNAVFEAYLDLSENLGRQEADIPSFDARPLLEAVTTLDTQGPESIAKEQIERLRNAVEALVKASPELARDTFKEVSAAAIALARVAPPSKDSVGKLYEVECPMAEASWLQRDNVVSNPYFADMKSCGEVKRSFTLRESAP